MKSNLTLSESDLIAKARLNMRHRVIGIVTLGALSGISSAWLIGTPDNGTLTELKGAGLWTVGVATTFGAGIILWLTRAPRGSDNEQITNRLADELQQKRATGLLLFALFAVLATHSVWLASGRIVAGSANASAYIALGSVLMVSLCFLASVFGLGSGRKLNAVFNDELSRHLRSRAVMVGFGFLFCGVLAIFAIGIDHPAVAIRAVPLLMLYAAAAVSVSYGVMDLRAGASD